MIIINICDVENTFSYNIIRNTRRENNRLRKSKVHEQLMKSLKYN